MNIINLTPHSITFYGEDGNIIRVIEPSGKIAKVVDSKVIDGIPIKHSSSWTIEGLPEKEDGVIYIVSPKVAFSCPKRDDLFIPGKAFLDEEGNTLGFQSLVRI